MALVCVALPAAGADGTAEDAIDPVVAEVVAMLEADLPPEIVREWLERVGRRPARLGGHEMVALNEAGADDELLRLFLELATEETGEDPERTPAETDAAKPEAARESAEMPAEPALVTRSPVDTFFTIHYKPKWQKDQEHRDLFVYLDGDFLARVPAADDRGLVALRRLETGWHRLVVAREAHVRSGGTSPSWTHESEVCQVPIDFVLPAGKNLEVQVVFRQFKKKEKRGPMHLKILRGNKLLGEQSQVGAPTSQWLPWCADVASEPCIAWSDLWDDYTDHGLETVRLELAKFDFAPPP